MHLKINKYKINIITYMDSDYENDFENETNESITASYIINIYEDNKDNIKNVKNELLYLINSFNIEKNISYYRDELYDIYYDVIKKHIDENGTLNILENKYNLCGKFIDWVYMNTLKGKEFAYLEEICININNENNK
jgi:hypothetical protein